MMILFYRFGGWSKAIPQIGYFRKQLLAMVAELLTRKALRATVLA